MKRKQLLALFVLGMIQIACVVGQGFTVTTERGTPPNIPAEIVQKPKFVQRGASATFSVKTDPQNTCRASIGYSNVSGAQVGNKLAEEKADEGGLCTWIWTVPPDIPKGPAHFYSQVSRAGETSSLIPWEFCIEECDD